MSMVMFMVKYVYNDLVLLTDMFMVMFMVKYVHTMTPCCLQICLC